jgi:hypothetical protein
LGVRAAIPIGGCGDWNGRMCEFISPPSMGSGRATDQKSPLISKGSGSVQNLIMMSRASHIIFRFTPPMPSTENTDQSDGMPPAPTPSMRRPCARWSR